MEDHKLFSFFFKKNNVRGGREHILPILTKRVQGFFFTVVLEEGSRGKPTAKMEGMLLTLPSYVSRFTRAQIGGRLLFVKSSIALGSMRALRQKYRIYLPIGDLACALTCASLGSTLPLVLRSGDGFW